MKFLKSFGIGLIVWIGLSILLSMIDYRGFVIKNTTLIFAIIVAIVAYLQMNKPIKNRIKETVSEYQDIKEVQEAKDATKDSSLYAIAEKEILEGRADEGLWSQALVEANGKEESRKIEYMKLRVKQLKSKV